MYNATAILVSYNFIVEGVNDLQSETQQHPHVAGGTLLRQPPAVWAVAFACVVAFMGLGLVDPILPVIARQLDATPSQVELLFTSYMLVTGLAMIVTGAVSSRIGPKWTLLLGLFLIVLFAGLGGSAHDIGQIVWYRGGWGLGNALFIATALAVIVSVASGGTAGAIILYEAALGLGLSVGPLLGGELGSISWRGPFFGVSVLMAIGFVAILIFLRALPKPVKKTSVLDPLRALRHRGLLTMALMALLYNFGFFTLLTFTPFVLGMTAIQLGYVYFGWGVFLAITSVFVAPRLQRRFGTLGTTYTMLALIAVDLLVIGLNVHNHVVVVIAIIVAGGFLGVNNTLVTTAVMQAAPVERPIASAAYSFVRFGGGAVAPWLAGQLAAWFSPHVPFYVGAAAVASGIAVLYSGRHFLRTV